MPFIKGSDRFQYFQHLGKITSIATKGDLEYCFFLLMNTFMKTRKFCYSDLHDCVYAAIHAGEEYKRLYLDKRENQARIENGDI